VEKWAFEAITAPAFNHDNMIFQIRWKTESEVHVNTNKKSILEQALTSGHSFLAIVQNYHLSRMADHYTV
jgi:streptomycin 6-kinase